VLDPAKPMKTRTWHKLAICAWLSHVSELSLAAAVLICKSITR
jgi:hypothetical protein